MSTTDSSSPTASGDDAHVGWTVILRDEASQQIVVYNADSRQLQIVKPSNRILDRQSDAEIGSQVVPAKRTKSRSFVDFGHQDCCPLCRRPLERATTTDYRYFEMLDRLTAASRSPSPHSSGRSSAGAARRSIEMTSSLPSAVFNQGYFARFFRQERLLGRGGNGCVFLCRHELEGHVLGRFAVKIVPIGDNVEWLERRLREVHAMCQLKHPHIIEYKHAWMEMYSSNPPFTPLVPSLFILMEWADSGSLETLLRDAQETDMSARAALAEALFGQAAKGLAHLHHSGILHRDLKPSNVLLTASSEGEAGPSLRVVLSDFGDCQPSSFLDDERSPYVHGGATGTVDYLAPEIVETGIQGDSARFTEKSDVWSLGIVLYELLHRELPYRHGNSEELLAEISALNRLEGCVFALDEQMGPRMQAILTAMLQIDPQRRADIDTVIALLRASDSVFGPAQSGRSSAVRSGFSGLALVVVSLLLWYCWQ